MSDCLQNRKILLGLTGGIAAYKAAELCREIRKAGAQVRVVMTKGACEFITPLTLQALSGNDVHTSLLNPEAESGMGHIELAKWPDLIVIAPASANFIAKYSSGMADDLLSTILLASLCPVAIAPAMNQAMWLHPLTQNNLSVLKNLLPTNFFVLGPAEGEQACGDVGPGRMLEPKELLFKLQEMAVFQKIDKPKSLSGKKVVITAGPTREAIDPVRYISNHSSGKMGYALAEACFELGAQVRVVSGPCQLEKHQGIQYFDVVSANDMYEKVHELIDEACDIFIACAAVADYKPLMVSDQKIKKELQGANEFHIALEENPDIVASVTSRKDKPFTVGFAAETQNINEYARNKLKRKHLDMIVANDVSVPGQGFNSEKNQVTIITPDDELLLELEQKNILAEKIVDFIATKLTHLKKT